MIGSRRAIGAAGLFAMASMILTGCAARVDASSDTVASTTSASLQPSPVPKQRLAPSRPSPLAWGKDEVKFMGWPLVGATINGTTLDLATSLYDKDENRGPGDAVGLCTTYAEYAQKYDIERIVVHASNSAPLVSAESTQTETWSQVYPPWVCHSAG